MNPAPSRFICFILLLLLDVRALFETYIHLYKLNNNIYCCPRARPTLLCSTDAATVVLRSVDLVANSARSAGAAYLFSSDLTHEGGEAVGNIADDDDAGALYFVATSFLVSDVLFDGNESSDDGGSIRILLSAQPRQVIGVADDGTCPCTRARSGPKQ